PDAILPHPLVGADLVALALLGLKVRIAEPREEQIVDRRRSKALAPRAAELGAGLLDEHRERRSAGELVAERVVVLVADAAAQDDAVEEPELVLSEPRDDVDLLAEGEAVLAVLVAMLPAERERVPLAEVEVVEPLSFAALGVDLGHRREGARRRRVLEAVVVEPLTVAQAGIPPVRHLLVVLYVVGPGLALLRGVRIEPRGVRGEHRQVRVRLRVTTGQRERAPPREVVVEATRERRLRRVVVLEEAPRVVVAAGQ